RAALHRLASGGGPHRAARGRAAGGESQAVRWMRRGRVHRIAGGSIGGQEKNAGSGVSERIFLHGRRGARMTLPGGFRYATAFVGIRHIVKDDVALIVSDPVAAAAAVFTRNRVTAAPVEVARKNLRLSRGMARAILVNAGNANCATRTGERVAAECV